MRGSGCGAAGVVATDEADGTRGAASTPAVDRPSSRGTSIRPGKHLAGSATVDGRRRGDKGPHAVVGMSKTTGGSGCGGSARYRDGREGFSPCKGGGHGGETGGAGAGKRYAADSDYAASECDAKWQQEDRRGFEDGVGVGADNDCEDPDSAYVTAMEQIWAEAEAWVDAEAQVTMNVLGACTL